MFPYTEKYTESEYDIQNNDLLYKINHKCQNTFEFLESFGIYRTIAKIEVVYFVLYISSIIHI